MLLYYSYLLPLAFSAFTSLTIVRLAWPRRFKHFSIFLLITLGVELFALLWSAGLHHTRWWHFSANNIWLYNIYLIPQYCFYIYFFTGISGLNWKRTFAWVLGLSYTGLILINFILWHNLFLVEAIPIIIGNLIVVFLTVTYFIKLMRASKVIRLKEQPLFWIAAGAFIFHLGSLPCFMLYKFIASADYALASSLFRIIVGLNWIMYILYSIAFLCTRLYPTSRF